MSKKKPEVIVTNAGVFRVNPADIFRSDVTRAIIKQTSQLLRTSKKRPQKPAQHPR